MPTDMTAGASLSRRSFIKTGTLGGMLLATGSATALLTGCAKTAPATGYRFLRAHDIVLLTAIAPSVLVGSLPEGDTQPAAVSALLTSLDELLASSSLATNDQIYQLFDLLSLPPARMALAGVWSDWPKASRADIDAFLLRWHDSSIGVLRAGYLGLSKILASSWFLLPQSWPATGYVAPIKVA